MNDKNVNNTHLKSCQEKIPMISSKNRCFFTVPRFRFVTHLGQNFQTSPKGKLTKCIPISYFI
jgi:hypothetical protein